MKSALKLNVENLVFVARKFSIVTHPARLQIIKLIEENGKLNVTQIYERLNFIQPETSLHLGLLKKYGILNKVRQGKMSIYSVNTETLESIIRISEELAR
jgi:DNA-binding transcriptional ArsR family regulator